MLGSTTVVLSMCDMVAGNFFICVQFVTLMLYVLNFSLGSRHFEAESRPCSGTRLAPLDYVCNLYVILSFYFILALIVMYR